MNVQKEKVKCRECNWKGFYRDLLRATNPFNRHDMLMGCPDCKDIYELFYDICDEKGCWNNASIGFPTKNGYRRTCFKHNKDK